MYIMRISVDIDSHVIFNIKPCELTFMHIEDLLNNFFQNWNQH